jgi:protocatechuate 3,4-dioxygenase beta subunit
MRTFCLGLLATTVLLGVGTVAKQPTPLVIDGRVITGAGAEARPVRRAHVTLSGKGLGATRVTDTDAKGAYRFDRVPPGNYRISFSKPGFVRFETDAGPGATHTMTRGGAIEGMVLDPGGVPLRGIMVNALQREDGARPRLASNAYTDDLGRYRLHSLAAGDYFLEASSQDLTQAQLLMPGEKRGTETRAYYPDVDTIESAKPVRVTAGRETTGLDLRLAPPVPVVDPAAPPPPPRADATGTARIAGRVTDAATGRSLNGARVLLVPLDGVALTNWKRSDAQGRFEYTQLEARRYRLTASADGLVQMEFGQKKPGEGGLAIQVKDGEDFKADISLPRAGAVEGILFDEFGDGAPRVLVQVARKQFVAGRHRLMPIESRQNSNTTDDRGRYRVSGLEPGEYHVAALSGAYVNEGAAGGFAPTYYPGSAEAGAATPVSVGFGAEIATPATFALVPARTFTVAGRMIDQDGNLVAGRSTVWLATPDSLKRMDFHLARGLTMDGAFVLRNVPQGRYTLQGFGRPPADYRGPMNLSAMPFGWTSITVGDADLEDVVLKVTNGTTLRGKIVPDDSAAAPPAAQTVRVSTIPVEFDSAPVGGGPSPSQTREDLTFEVVKQSGLRLIRVGVSSPNWALKKITLNDMDITDTPVDFRTRDVEGVEVILTPKVSRISGVVSDDNGPVASYAVVIFASDPTKWTDRSRFVAVARPTQQGRFELRGLPPEEYLAVALPGVTGTEWMDPEFLQQLRVNATSFVLTEGESRTLSLKLKRRP